MFFLENELRLKMREEFDEDFGRAKYTYVEREKADLFYFSLDKLLMIVSVRHHVDPKKMAKSINSLIVKYMKN